MSWTDLFKSKAARLKPDPRVRWFGKLPTYPDYYSSPTDEEWVVEFNEWVLKGFEIYQSRLANTNAAKSRMPLGGCVVRLPKSGMTVFASILDFGGDMRGRQFPICFYAGLPAPQWPGPTSDCLAGAARVVRDLMALRQEVGRFLNSPGQFEAVFGGRAVDLGHIDKDSSDNSWVGSGKALDMVTWFAGAKDALKIKDQDTWLRVVAAWGDTLSKHEGKDFEPTLCFPLATRVSTYVQIAGWIRWLESRMDLKRRLLSLVLSGDLDDEPGHLTVIARAVVPEDFLLLTGLAGTLPYLDDVSVLECTAVGEEDGPAGEPAGSAPSGPASWIDFVEGA